MKGLFSDRQMAALIEELLVLSRLIVSVAVLGTLSATITATLGSVLLTVGFLVTLVVLFRQNSLAKTVDELREVRKYVLAGLFLAWATNGLTYNDGFWVIVVMALVTFVIELAVLSDT